MKAKGIWTAVCIFGTVLIVLPLLISAVVILTASGTTTSIVGGADWPTFVFILQKYLWISWTGVLLSIAAIIGLIRKK